MSNNYQVVQIAARPARSAELRAARAAELSESACRVRPRAASGRALGRGTRISLCVNTESSCCCSSSWRRSRGVLLHGRPLGQRRAASPRPQTSRASGAERRWRRYGRRRLRRRRRRLRPAGPRPPMTVELAPVDAQGHDRHDHGRRQPGRRRDGRRGSARPGAARCRVREARRPGPPRPGDRENRGPRDRRADQAGRGDLQRVAGDDSPAAGGPEARAEQHGALEEPVRARPAAPADVRRHRRALPGGAGAARARRGADGAVRGAARRAEDQPREHVITSPVDGFIGKRTLDPGRQRRRQHVVHLRRRHPHGAAGHQRRRERSAAHSPGHGGRGRSRRVSRREVQRPRRASRADSRPRDAHRAGGNRDSQPRATA